ncbi:MAG: RluA family pseudouridine synthase [Candidatus Aminicenantes bacterium]
MTDESGENHRLDLFLCAKLDGWSRAKVQRFILKGRVLVDGKRRRPSYKLKRDEKIVIDVTVRKAGPLKPENIPLTVIHEDPHLVVIDKPSGMVVHPGAGGETNTLANALLFRFPDVKGIGPKEKPGIVHRLDRETSGVILIARTPMAYQELQRQFKAREVEKLYLGLVWGKMPDEEGKITWSIGRHAKHGERMSIKTDKPRVAETSYRVKKTLGEFTLLEIRPLTGRTHQIRVHMAASGHPVVGDPRYGRTKVSSGCPRLFLHAHRITIAHPRSGERVSFQSPLPRDLNQFLEELSANPQC